MRFNRILCLMIVTVALAACTGSDVDIVKNGSMGGYQTTTVGGAFDASFDNPKWSAFKGKKGERVVEFSGTISEAMQKASMDDFKQALVEERGRYGTVMNWFNDIPEAKRQVLWEMADGATNEERYEGVLLIKRMEDWEVGSPVVFQWVVSPDGNIFDLTYVEGKGWENYKTDYILDLIYR